jgi:hypothetical protein
VCGEEGGRACDVGEAGPGKKMSEPGRAKGRKRQTLTRWGRSRRTAGSGAGMCRGRGWAGG